MQSFGSPASPNMSQVLPFFLIYEEDCQYQSEQFDPQDVMDLGCKE